MASKFELVFHLSLLLLVLVILPSLPTAHSRPQWFSRRDGVALLDDDEPEGNGTIWAVLVAGSAGFGNYRHQADVCHAYQILKSGGLKDENIVVFMYDDIATSPDNPRQGIIINHPEGGDVYDGVPKDYTRDNATVENLYAVLLANKTGLNGGSGKVVDSQPNDRIFIYYADHGDTGILGMPSGDLLYASDFNNVLKEKHAAGTYKEMVIYIEACESGSIFEGLLPEDLNIYATTASNAYESSWATYCPGDNTPPPPDYYVCLGDLYSVAWMEDSETHDSKIETLEQQYEEVKLRTFNKGHYVGSHVMEYGTKSLKPQKLYLYQGFSKINSSANLSHFNNGVMEGVDQRNVDLMYLQRKYNKLTDGSEEKAQLLTKITDIKNYRARLDGSMDKIGSLLFGEGKGNSILGFIRDQGLPVVDDWGCLKYMVRTFETHCGSLTRYGWKHMRAFANMCNNGVATSAMEEASKEACKGYNLGQ